ncbi:hypothetical protein VMCG_09864 [Cytospora schulzeri]|uniref:Major facilitator superfamily (MFS) profile domain-containing protein n=1 Tax=Cytospora schulzeri TaxID=448051 RepID=A0A423VDY8_9PEZI|nr:hypothetical protein VMCG_09864 [Valsa malicola]
MVATESKPSYGWRFWAVFFALAVTSLLAAVESTVTSTALPIISSALNSGELYVWFGTAYSLTSTAFTPLFGQIADVFGRRWLTISIVAVFALGSGISGGASSTRMLIAGRAVQGIALTYGGSIYSWSSWRVLLPLLLGFAGLAVFVLYETSRWCVVPVTPPHLFKNRTSAAAFFLTFVHALYSFWVLYFLPVYFQAVLLSGPERSGVLLLATVIILVPGGMVSGIILTKTGRYRPLHFAGYALMTLGTGLFILLDKDTSIAVVVVLQIVGGLGSGLALTTLLPAAQASLSDKDTASSTATWTFIRTFGTVWGVSVPSAIFNSRASNLAVRIEDTSVRALIANGQAYSHASADFLRSLPGDTLEQVTSVFVDSLRLVWIVATAIVGVSFFVVFVEKEIKLRDNLETEYGLDNGQEKGQRPTKAATETMKETTREGPAGA